MPALLQTPRLILRPWRPSDAAELYRHARDPRVGPVAGWPVHTSEQMSADVIASVFAAPETYAIVLRQTGLPVGSVGLLFGQEANVPLADGEAELGYWVGARHWGGGLAPEATRELVRHAFEDLGISRLWACCGVENGSSRRVMEKCGFAFERMERDVPFELVDEVRDEYVASLDAGSWEAGGLTHDHIEPAVRLVVAGDRDRDLVDGLLAVWESSVRATHDFLSEADIRRISAYVPDAFGSVETLVLAHDGDGFLSGFAGVTGDELEMLFITPKSQGGGIGKALLRVAMEGYGVTRLDVNEQNGRARGFYEHMGFEVTSRSATDGNGDPFPILHMRLAR